MKYKHPTLTHRKAPFGSKCILSMVAALLLSLPLLATATTDSDQTAIPVVQAIASDHARFHGYRVQRQEDGLTIRGHLLKSPIYPRSLRGRIQVQLLNAEGAVIRSVVTDYRRFPSKKRRQRFEIQVGELPNETHSIRLIHLV